MEMIRHQREVMFEEEDQEDEEQQQEEYEQDMNGNRYEDDASSAVDDCHERRVVSVRSAVGSMSYYTDPSVPLSLFLIDGVLPQRHDDDDDIAGGMGQETSGDSQYPRQQGYRKSPLEVTLSPPKPLVNPTTRYTPIFSPTLSDLCNLSLLSIYLSLSLSLLWVFLLSEQFEGVCEGFLGGPGDRQTGPHSRPAPHLPCQGQILGLWSTRTTENTSSQKCA